MELSMHIQSLLCSRNILSFENQINNHIKQLKSKTTITLSQLEKRITLSTRETFTSRKIKIILKEYEKDKWLGDD